MLRRSLFFLPFMVTRAFSHSYEVAAIKVGHAWALPADQALDGQAFMPLLNTGSTPDSLIAARSDICSMIQLRAHNKYDILPMNDFYLEPGKPFPMTPTRKHLRLMGLKKPLILNDRFALVLDFENAGEIEVEVHVETSPGD